MNDIEIQLPPEGVIPLNWTLEPLLEEKGSYPNIVACELKMAIINGRI